MKSISRELTNLINVVALAPLVALVFVCSAPAQEMAQVRGVLADQQGARVHGASVSLENEALKRRIRSDQEGRFEFDVPPGKYKLSVASHGFDDFARVVVLNSGFIKALAISLFPTQPRGSHAVLADLEVAKEARVRGVIADQSGARVPDTLVTIESQALKRTTVSDQWGGFEFNVPAGKYKLSVVSYGWHYFARDVLLNPGANEEPDIKLSPAAGLLNWSRPVAAEPEVTIEAVHAPVFHRMSSMKLR